MALRPTLYLVKGMLVQKDHQPNGVYQKESSLRRRFFTFSAGDKLSLMTQMADIGEHDTCYLPDQGKNY